MFKRFGAGFAVGYVFGARAGQKRYEQLTDLAERALDSPVGSQLADRARNLATADNGKRLLGQVKDRARQAGFGRAGDEETDDYDDEDAGDYDDEEEAGYDDEEEAGYDDDGDEPQGDYDDDEEPRGDYDDDEPQGDYDEEEEPRGDYDDEDEGDYEGQDEPDAREEDEDVVEDRDEDSDDGDGEDAVEGHQDGDRRRRRNHRSRSDAPRRNGGRVTALAAAARDRGRVD